MLTTYRLIHKTGWPPQHNETKRGEARLPPRLFRSYTYERTLTNNPFWITDASNFSNPAKFNKTIHLIEEELIRSKEDFVTHFKEIYSNPYPPAWILMEVLPFGVVTNIYANIKNKKLKKLMWPPFPYMEQSLLHTCNDSCKNDSSLAFA